LRISTLPPDFVSDITEVVNMMLKRGYTEEELEKTMEKVRIKYPALFVRHNIRNARDARRLVSAFQYRQR
jgi:hypothetical protein